MTAKLLEFPSKAVRLSVRRKEVASTLSLQFDGAVPRDATGRLDADFAKAWQAKVDALGLGVDVAQLNDRQFSSLAQLMAIWSFCVKHMLQNSSGFDEAATVYAQAVLSGEGNRVPPPDDVQRAVRAIVPRRAVRPAR